MLFYENYSREAVCNIYRACTYLNCQHCQERGLHQNVQDTPEKSIDNKEMLEEVTYDTEDRQGGVEMIRNLNTIRQ